ncbi:MAG: hypothetical protein P8N75_14035 [Ascidiaceihabitans sp.]|jgi:colicin import membrane protein|nr:hypothetical protein [Ascidiaceihabitans sp.]
MKNLLWIVVAAVIVGGGYMLYSGFSPKKLMNSAAEAVNAPEALESAWDAVGDAVEVIEGAVAGAVNAASDATAAEAAADAVAAATTEAASGGMADLLSVDGFNLDKVSEMIDGSEIGAFQKTVLKTALEKAKDNPSVLQTVLDKIKEAAGL